MVDLQSSYLKSAEYDAAAQHLTISFHDGSRWRYWGVTKPTWDAFQSSGSKGRFFREVIRGQGHHKAERL